MQTRKLSYIVLATLGFASAASADPLSYTYTYDGTGNTPNASFPDTGTVEFNNNALGPSSINNSSYQDAAWIGFATGSGQVRINIDFGGEFDFTSLAITYLVDTSFAQTRGPASVDISIDGGGFVNLVGFDNSAGQARRTTTLDLTPHSLSGENAVLRFNVPTGPWMFLSEADFEGTEAVPEPSSAALALGGLMLLARRRRS